MRNAARQTQYLAGHWLTRVLLARAFGGAPGLWKLLECKSHAPKVLDHADAIRVSISHSGDWVAAAVATVAIGIDLEQRPRTLDATIEPLLRNADEAPGTLGQDELLRRWVAKEAWLKRHGESALPDRLRHLHLHAITDTDAELHIASHDGFHIGLAVAADCTVATKAPVALVAGPDFTIIDLESTATSYRT